MAAFSVAAFSTAALRAAAFSLSPAPAKGASAASVPFTPGRPVPSRRARPRLAASSDRRGWMAAGSGAASSETSRSASCSKAATLRSIRLMVSAASRFWSSGSAGRRWRRAAAWALRRSAARRSSSARSCGVLSAVATVGSAAGLGSGAGARAVTRCGGRPAAYSSSAEASASTGAAGRSTAGGSTGAGRRWISGMRGGMRGSAAGAESAAAGAAAARASACGVGGS